MTNRITDPRIGHWGYWRDDYRKGTDTTRIRVRVLPR
jgi:hypothetical protein